MATDYFAPFREIRGEAGRQRINLELGALNEKAQEAKSNRKLWFDVLSDPKLTPESKMKFRDTGNAIHLKTLEDQRKEDRIRNWEEVLGGDVNSVDANYIREHISELFPESVPTAEKLIKMKEGDRPTPYQQQILANEQARIEETKRYHDWQMSKKKADNDAKSEAAKLIRNGDYIDAKVRIDGIIRELESRAEDLMPEEAQEHELEISRLKSFSKGLEHKADGKETGYSKYVDQNTSLLSDEQEPSIESQAETGSQIFDPTKLSDEELEAIANGQ
jgi:hypothetical protein